MFVKNLSLVMANLFLFGSICQAEPPDPVIRLTEPTRVIYTKMTFTSANSISPNGEEVAVTSGSFGAIAKYELVDGERTWQNVHKVAFSISSGVRPVFDDQGRIVVVLRDGNIHRFANSNSESEKLFPETGGGYEGVGRSVRTLNLAFSPDFEFIGVGTHIGAHVLNYQTQEKVGFVKTNAWVNQIVFHPTLNIMGVGITRRATDIANGLEHPVLLFSREGERLGEIGSSQSCYGLSFSPDGDKLVVSGTGQVEVFDTKTWQGVQLDTSLISFPVATSCDGKFILNGRYIIAGLTNQKQNDSAIGLWDVETGGLLVECRFQKTGTGGVNYSAKHNLLIGDHGTNFDGKLTVWEMPDFMRADPTATDKK